MAFYAAPSYDLNVVSLGSGYTPPLSSAASATLSNSGPYLYAPSSYLFVNNVLSPGYLPPPANSVSATMQKDIASSEQQYVFSNGFDSSFIGSLVASPTQTISAISIEQGEVSSLANIFLHTRYIIAEQILSASATLYYPKSYNQYDYDITIIRPYGDYLNFGKVLVEPKNKSLVANGFYSQSFSVGATVRNSASVVDTASWQSGQYGDYAVVVNFNQTISPDGEVFFTTGEQLIYNYTNYLSADGIDSSDYGDNYLQGGVKELLQVGEDQSLYGDLLVINTMGDQYITPEGLKELSIPASPIVYPYIAHTEGIFDGGFGAPLVAPTPELEPKGLVQTKHGVTTVGFYIRYLQPVAQLAYQSGYPIVKDPTQFIQAQALIVTAIFGDTYTKNVWTIVRPISVFDGAIPDYHATANKNRMITPSGIRSFILGSTLVANKSPSLFFKGIEPLSIGSQGIGYRIRSVLVSGFYQDKIGSPDVDKTPELLPIGFEDSSIGTVFVSNKVRFIEAAGDKHDLTGLPELWFRYRSLSLTGWSSSDFSEPILTHGVREVISQGLFVDNYGDAWISHGTRLLEPKSVYKDFESNHFVGRHQEVKPNGFIASLFGNRVTPDQQRLYAQGFNGLWGLATTQLRTRYVIVNGFISVGKEPIDRWGKVSSYNKTQYIIQEYDSNSDLTPPNWSDWTFIENKNKQLSTSGLSSLRFGYSQIDNYARQLLVAGLPPVMTGRFDVSEISHANRNVRLEGIEPSAISSWSAVFNAARVINPIGNDFIGDSKPAIANNRRYFENISSGDTLMMGDHMVAYRIRKVDIESRYSIAPPQINLPDIQLFTNYASFIGLDLAHYGTPALSIHFNIISPNWVYQDKLGLPALKNQTPELGVYGFNSDQFGNNYIRNQFRFINHDGHNSQLFGALLIADTTRKVELLSWQDTTYGLLHEVIKGETKPYTTQYLLLNEDDVGNESKGAGINQLAFGSIGVNQNVLYADGINRLEFGQSLLWSNNITPIGFRIENIPESNVVYNKNSVIKLDADDAINPQLKISKPRISPHTIYAKEDVSLQARENHPESGVFTPIGGKNGSSDFGQPKAESTIRSISPFGFTNSYLGFNEPLVDLSLRIILPSPFSRLNFGIPKIPFTPQDITIRNGVDSLEFGDGFIESVYTGPTFLEPFSIYGFSSTEGKIENKKRYVQPLSYDGLIMGSSIGDPTPYMWQVLRVGAFVPMIISAGDTSLYGNTTVSLKIRELSLLGFDAFRSEYELSNFDKRIRVVGERASPMLDREINVSGISAPEAPTLDVKLGQRYIRPDGNSDQFRKGGYHA